MSVSRKSGIIPHIIIVGCTFLFCSVIAALLYINLGEKAIEKYFHISPYGYMYYFFNQENSVSGRKGTTKYVPEANSHIVIVSPTVSKEISIDSLAHTIRTLASYNPRVIAFDLLYMPPQHLDVDHYREVIQKAIGESNCPVLFPSIISRGKDDTATVRNSFFIDSTMCSASLPDFWSFSRYDSIDPSIERFPFAIARLSGYMRDELQNLSDYRRFIPDYRWKDFPVISGLSGCCSDNLSEQIVIVGDLNDFKDLKTAPFKIEGTEIIPGIKLIAYLVNTLITPEYNSDRRARERDNVIFRRNTVLDCILCFVFLLIYVIITRVINHQIEKWDNQFLRVISVLIKLVSVLFWEFVIYRTCTFITSHWYVVFNLLAAMLPCLFVESFDAIFSKPILKKSSNNRS